MFQLIVIFGSKSSRAGVVGSARHLHCDWRVVGLGRSARQWSNHATCVLAAGRGALKQACLTHVDETSRVLDCHSGRYTGPSRCSVHL